MAIEIVNLPIFHSNIKLKVYQRVLNMIDPQSSILSVNITITIINYVLICIAVIYITVI